MLAIMSKMAINAKNILGVDKIDATADSGYHHETEVAKCERENINCYIPKPTAQSSKTESKLFTKADFGYDADNDCYLCPANQTLTYCRQTNWGDRKQQKKYSCRKCKDCSLRPQCLGNKRGNRYLFRGIHEDLIDQMEQRVHNNPDIVKQRKELVEHPFGTIKHWMDQGYFLMRGFEKVNAEMSLTALCYNIKRVLNIFDVKELIENLIAMQQTMDNLNYKFLLLLISSHFIRLKQKYSNFMMNLKFISMYSMVYP
jgi:hypothetical protein